MFSVREGEVRDVHSLKHASTDSKPRHALSYPAPLCCIIHHTCSPPPTSLTHLINRPLFPHGASSHTCTNTAVRPHAKPHVRLKSRCSVINKWHRVVAAACVCSNMYFFFSSWKVNPPVNRRVSAFAPSRRLIFDTWLTHIHTSRDA